MGKIYFTSDLHFCHNKPFIYEPRGFKNIENMNNTLLENFNNCVCDDDDVYILGDCMLGSLYEGLSWMSKLNGKLHIILGNHDTTTKEKEYKKLKNVVEVCLAKRLKINGWHFYLSHYPTITGKFDKIHYIKRIVISLYGHTHQTENFSEDVECGYHVGVDSHNLQPVSFEEIELDILNKFN